MGLNLKSILELLDIILGEHSILPEYILLAGLQLILKPEEFLLLEFEEIYLF